MDRASKSGESASSSPAIEEHLDDAVVNAEESFAEAASAMHTFNSTNELVVDCADDARGPPHGFNGPLTGQFMALMNMTKANLGPGILALPFAFKNSGLALGVICVMLFGIICTHCMQLIVDAAQYFSNKLEQKQSGFAVPRRLSYQSVARLAFQHSPLHRWADSVYKLTIGFLFLTQMGFCCVYMVFVARTVENVLLEYPNATSVNIRYIELMWAPLFLALVMVRNLKPLAFLSTVANIVMTALLVVVYQEEIRHLRPISTVVQFGSINNFPRFFVTAVFAFEGISCVLPVENKMLRPEKFGGTFGILNQAMTIVTIMFGITGFFGYWAYGDAVAGSISYSLPNSPVYLAAKIAAAAAVFVSYAIQAYVPIQIVMPCVRRRFPAAQRSTFPELTVRALFWVVTLALALFIPHLAEFIGLIGAFGCSYLALILPPIVDTLRRYGMNCGNVSTFVRGRKKYGRFCWIIVKNVVIVLIGVTGFGIGTYISVSDIVEQFKLDALGNNTNT